MHSASAIAIPFITRYKIRIFILLFTTIISALLYSPGYGESINARYRWMLPKTVLDTTVTYTFISCNETKTTIDLNVLIEVNWVARAVPDKWVGLKTINPENLKSF